MTATKSKDVFLRRDANLMLRLNHRIKGAIRQLAAREGVPMTAKIEGLILDELKRKGVSIELSEIVI